MVDHPRMTPEQTTALDRAIELIGEFFDDAVIVVQPNPQKPDAEVRYRGSCLAAASLCDYGGMFCNGELEAGDEEEESDDGDDWKKEKA